METHFENCPMYYKAEPCPLEIKHLIKKLDLHVEDDRLKHEETLGHLKDLKRDKEKRDKARDKRENFKEKLYLSLSLAMGYAVIEFTFKLYDIVKVLGVE